MLTDSVVVNFDSIHHEIKKTLFTIYDPVKKTNRCSRQQLPLSFAFSMTVHKAQGMSLLYLEIDCASMFCAGQMDVVVGRAVSSKCLRIFNYNATAARLKHHASVLQFCDYILQFYDRFDNNNEAVPNDNSLACCNQHIIDSPIPTSADITDTLGPINVIWNSTPSNIEPLYLIPPMEEVFTFNVEEPHRVFQMNLLTQYLEIVKNIYRIVESNHFRHRNTT